MDQCIGFCPFFTVKPFQTDTKFRVKDHVAVEILLIKLFSHTADKHYRKFQALALVDAHETNGIFLLTDNLRFTIIHIVFHQPVNVSDKMKQSVITGLFICHCFFHQHIQICPTLFARRQRCHVIAVASLIQNFLQ